MKRSSKLLAWSALVGLLVALPQLAAALPTGMDHRDPKAPCFRWPAVDYDGDGVFDRLDRCPDTRKGCVVDEFGCLLDEDRDGVCDGLDKCPGTPADTKVDGNGCSQLQLAAMNQPRQTPPAPVRQPPAPPPVRKQSETERLLTTEHVVRLSNVQFETNSARLLPESEGSLNEAGEALEKYPELRIEIGGHTDTRGSVAFNKALSQARAASVRQYLIDRFHLEPSHLIARGFGEAVPLISPEHTADDLQQNRRVELTVLNPEALPKNVKVEGGN